MSTLLTGLPIAPALIYGIEGKADKSYNFLSYVGAECFKKEFGIDYIDFQDNNVESQREKAIRNMAQKGHNPIISVTYFFENAMKKVAKEFPSTKFGIFGTFIHSPNIQSLHFKNYEGTFLAGVAAALATKTGKVGLISAVDNSLIRAFGYGYVQGVKYIDKNIIVMHNIIGDNNVYSYNNPQYGAAIAERQFNAGVDVVFPVAGATGLGVLQAAKNAGKLGIGFYVNQNYLYPGSILTSAVEKWDKIIYNIFRSALEGHWQAGVKWFGLKENAVDWSLDKFNRPLIPAQMEKVINTAKADIISGKIKVIDYRVSPDLF